VGTLHAIWDQPAAVTFLPLSPPKLVLDLAFWSWTSSITWFMVCLCPLKHRWDVDRTHLNRDEWLSLVTEQQLTICACSSHCWVCADHQLQCHVLTKLHDGDQASVQMPVVVMCWQWMSVVRTIRGLLSIVCVSLHPGDLYPFTRKPLFIIIDSDNSSAFEVGRI